MEYLPSEILNIIFEYANICIPSINTYIYESTKYTILDNPKYRYLTDPAFVNCLENNDNPVLLRKVISIILDNLDIDVIRSKADIYNAITDDAKLLKILTDKYEHIVEEEIDRRKFIYCDTSFTDDIGLFIRHVRFDNKSENMLEFQYWEGNGSSPKNYIYSDIDN